MKCSKNISSLQTAANYTRVPCLTTNGSYLYAIYDRDYYYHRQPQPSCSLISVAPVDFDQDIKFPSYEAVMELLQAGFDVGWSVECRDCSLAGKGCLVSSWDQPLTYACSRGQYHEVQRTHITSNYLNIGGNWYRSSSWSVRYNSHIGGRYPQVSERTKKSSQEEAAESAMLDTNNQQFWN
ncbi:unnamed protein product [Prunus armeniaca]|uniref:Uncharacterized protein n=1 Tax=Prunus armeniaca TaxID=36596 RepID=A0A6J5TMI4_PRUAR|nr:unnamed protein product [Prunus armeniaca]